MAGGGQLKPLQPQVKALLSNGYSLDSEATAIRDRGAKKYSGGPSVVKSWR